MGTRLNRLPYYSRHKEVNKKKLQTLVIQFKWDTYGFMCFGWLQLFNYVIYQFEIFSILSCMAVTEAVTFKKLSGYKGLKVVIF